MKMKELMTKEDELKRFVNEIAEYNNYLITGEWQTNPYKMYGLIYLSARDGKDTKGIKLDISEQPMKCSLWDVSGRGYASPDYEYGSVKSIRFYDKRDREKGKEDQRLVEDVFVSWGQAGVVIKCEKETVVIIAQQKTNTRFTVIDAKLHIVKKCCECPYIDTEYGMCRYPNAKEIPIEDYESITPGCKLRVKE